MAVIPIELPGAGEGLEKAREGLAKLAEDFKAATMIWGGRRHGKSLIIDELRQAIREKGKSGFADLYLGSFPAMTSDEIARDTIRITTLKDRGTVTGTKTGDFIVLDSLPEELGYEVTSKSLYIDHDLMMTFQDKAFPEATVTVRRELLDRHDPRNPNPKAPPGEQFFLYVHGRKSTRAFSVLKLAEVSAEELHKRLVKGLRDEALAKLPNFGRF